MSKTPPAITEEIEPGVTEEIQLEENSADITVMIVPIEERFGDLSELLTTYKLREAVTSPSGRKVLLSGGTDDNDQDRDSQHHPHHRNERDHRHKGPLGTEVSESQEQLKRQP